MTDLSEAEVVRWRFDRHGPLRVSHYNRGYRKFNNGIRWFRIYVAGHDLGGLWFSRELRLPRLLGPSNRVWHRRRPTSPRPHPERTTQ